VDRAEAFYTEKTGFHADHDYVVTEALRFVQLTPAGSGCSIAIGSGLTQMPPGAVQGLQLVVADIRGARADVLGGAPEAWQTVPLRHSAIVAASVGWRRS
jgi:catechol 2,3-dioxygenase-like lactoylglutathione lyase family enzyme